MRAVLLLVGLLAACATDGRTLSPPGPDQTTSTTAPRVAPIAPADGRGASLVLSSPVVEAGAILPVDHTCVGENVSPPLSWVGVPDEAVELVVVVRDPADGLVHWALAGIDPVTVGLAEDAGVPLGAVEAIGGLGEPGWFGPCPQPEETRQVTITLFALGQESGAGPGTGAESLLATASANALDRAAFDVFAVSDP